MRNLRIVLAVIFVMAIARTTLVAQPPAAYVKEMNAWHAERIHELKAPDGWLNLAGLYWLKEGRNSFGTGVENTVVFPFGTLAAVAGYFQRVGDSVVMVITGESGVTVDGKATKEAVVFSRGFAEQPVVAIRDLRFSIIKREDKLGVRLRDLNSPLLRNFKDIDRFPLDTNWRVSAVLKQEGVPKQIAITNAIGQTSQLPSPGKLFFTYRGAQYSLETLEDDGALLVVFGDGTSGKSTYPAGRFVTVEKPKPGSKDNWTVIDFNKAYNPPCAFTTYATCPLPPKANVLPIDVEAGEKNYGK